MNSDEKKCSFCAEIIKFDAIRCKHCGSDVDNEVAYRETNDSSERFNFYRLLKIFGVVVITTIILISSNPKKSSFVNHIDMKVMNYANQNGGALGLGIAALISTPVVNKAITRYDFHAFSIFKIDSSISKMIDENPKSDSPIYYLGAFHFMYYKIPNSIAERLLGFVDENNSTTISKKNNPNSSQFAYSHSDAVSEYMKGITTDCPSLITEKDVLVKDMVLYADPKNKVLVYLGRGNRSSDILIFNLKDNSFTSISNLFPENNELHKISKFDVERLPPPKSTASCNFKNDLKITGFFSCDGKTGSFQCKWMK